MDLISIAEQWNSLGLIPCLIYAVLRSEKRQEATEVKLEEARRESEAKFEAMARTWQKQLNEMVDKHDAKEESVRDRYDAVVLKLDQEKKQQSDRCLEEVRALGVKVDDMTRFLSRPMR